MKELSGIVVMIAFSGAAAALAATVTAYVLQARRASEDEDSEQESARDALMRELKMSLEWEAESSREERVNVNIATEEWKAALKSFEEHLLIAQQSFPGNIVSSTPSSSGIFASWTSLTKLGNLAVEQGELERAREFYLRALERAERMQVSEE